MKPVVVHIFHRDLRTQDNLGFLAAIEKAKINKCELLPLFVFTPEQFTDKNPYRSENSIQFMLESLEDLNTQLDNNLTLMEDTQLAALLKLQQTHKIIAVSETRDYTPYAKIRETETLLFCTQYDIEYIGTDDVYLTTPGTVLNKSGKPYQKFTPFYEAAKLNHVPTPKATNPTLINKILYKAFTKPFPKYNKNPQIHVNGGTKSALDLLQTLKTLDYTKTHDIPSIDTSNLSAHNHFGTVSIRAVFHASTNTEFRRQLYWRDFYGHITYHFETLYKVSPYAFQKGTWKTNAEALTSWQNGTTGHELVDAGMRQLKATGYIHNRARLVSAIYLTKHLQLDWRLGERWFAQHLVDYDFAQNFGNWCWVASVLPFSMAPFRSLDPEIQLKKFDPKKAYVNKWLKP
jgi:deoxyribodipyrimidine photo-lyase